MYVFGTNSINKDIIIENYEINAMQREFFLQFMQVLIEDEEIVRKILIFIENLAWNFMKKQNLKLSYKKTKTDDYLINNYNIYYSQF